MIVETYFFFGDVVLFKIVDEFLFKKEDIIVSEGEGQDLMLDDGSKLESQIEKVFKPERARE